MSIATEIFTERAHSISQQRSIDHCQCCLQDLVFSRRSTLDHLHGFHLWQARFGADRQKKTVQATIPQDKVADWREQFIHSVKLQD